MTKKICLSFDHPSLLITPTEKEAAQLIRGLVFQELSGAGHEPFETFHKGSPPTFEAELSTSMHALVVLHSSIKPQRVNFNMALAHFPAGLNSAVPIPVVIIEFPGVDYSRFTVSSNNVIISTKTLSDGKLSLLELLPELFGEPAYV